MSSEPWRDTIYQRLVEAPAEGLVLGQLFEEVKLEIPLHFAMRQANKMNKQPVSADLAQWNYFKHAVRSLVRGVRVERIDGTTKYWEYHDRIRLLPSELRCENCGSCLYPVRESAKGRSKKSPWVCPKCDHDRFVPPPPAASSQPSSLPPWPPLVPITAPPSPPPSPSSKPAPMLRSTPVSRGNGYHVVSPPPSATAPAPSPPLSAPTLQPSSMPAPLPTSMPSSFDAPRPKKNRKRYRRVPIPPPLAPLPDFPQRQDFVLQNAKLPQFVWFKDRRMAARVLRRFFTDLSINQIHRELERQTIPEFLARRGTNLPYVLRWLMHRGLANIET